MRLLGSRSWTALAALVLVAPAIAQNPIAERLDPRTDPEWRSEALAAAAGERLQSALTDALGRAADEAATLPAVREWARPLRGAVVRTKVKLLSADVDGATLTTRARIEAFGQRASAAGAPPPLQSPPTQSPLVQSVTNWRVTWSIGENGELALESIAAVGGERAAAERVWFAEVTDAVLGPELVAKPELRFGGSYWVSRVDHVGESARMGHQGVAVGDVDGDGREDVYVGMPNGLPNLLLRRRADGTFEDIAAAAGVAFLDDTKGVLLLDLDGDGDDDLVLAIGPFLLLCDGDGAGRFRPAHRLQAPTGGAFYHVTAVDFDRDGDLDLYGCRYVEEAYAESVPLPYHAAENGPRNLLFRNDGEGGFTDVTAALGLDANNTRFSTAAAWADYDDDGDVDLYVSNDFGFNNLYRNDGARFVDVAVDAGVEDQGAGMGVAFADVDADGDLDLYVTNMFSSAGHRIGSLPAFQARMSAAERGGLQGLSRGNSLYLNAGDGTFVRAPEAGVRMGRWGWGARFVDLDTDGLPDIVAPNGFLTGRPEAADC